MFWSKTLKTQTLTLSPFRQHHFNLQLCQGEELQTWPVCNLSRGFVEENYRKTHRKIGKPWENHGKMKVCPLVNIDLICKITIIKGKTHYKWPNVLFV